MSFIELPKIEHWISLSSGYHNSVLNDKLYREQVGRVWKWVILIWVGIQSHSWLAFETFFSIHHRPSTISSPTSTWSSIHLLFSPVLKIERKHAGNGSVDSKGSWWWCKGDVEVPLKSWLFSCHPVLVETVWGRIEHSQWRSWNNWTSSWWINLSFSFGGGGGSVVSEWPAHLESCFFLIFYLKICDAFCSHFFSKSNGMLEFFLIVIFNLNEARFLPIFSLKRFFHLPILGFVLLFFHTSAAKQFAWLFCKTSTELRPGPFSRRRAVGCFHSVFYRLIDWLIGFYGDFKLYLPWWWDFFFTFLILILSCFRKAATPTGTIPADRPANPPAAGRPKTATARTTGAARHKPSSGRAPTARAAHTALAPRNAEDAAWNTARPPGAWNTARPPGAWNTARPPGAWNTARPPGASETAPPTTTANHDESDRVFSLFSRLFPPPLQSASGKWSESPAELSETQQKWKNSSLLFEKSSAHTQRPCSLQSRGSEKKSRGSEKKVTGQWEKKSLKFWICFYLLPHVVVSRKKRHKKIPSSFLPSSRLNRTKNLFLFLPEKKRKNDRRKGLALRSGSGSGSVQAQVRIGPGSGPDRSRPRSGSVQAQVRIGPGPGPDRSGPRSGSV